METPARTEKTQSKLVGNLQTKSVKVTKKSVNLILTTIFFCIFAKFIRKITTYLHNNWIVIILYLYADFPIFYRTKDHTYAKNKETKNICNYSCGLARLSPDDGTGLTG